MPRISTRSRKPGKDTQEGKELQRVPTENVEIIKKGLGVDVSKLSPDKMQALVRTMSQSMSASPYSSGQMLQEYVNSGFPELPDKIIGTIDKQIDHRQTLEIFVTKQSEKREDRAQIGAQFLAFVGLIGALVAAYSGVSKWVCIIAVIAAIGGPNAATILARILDRNR